MPHPDLHAEQAHLDRAWARPEAARGETQEQLQEAFRERGSTFQSFTERDIRVRNSLNRLEKLELGRESLIFGRIDAIGPAGAPGPAGTPGPAGAPGPAGSLETMESFHIGRLALSDADHEPLVVDWRAPVAEPFYRATGAHPMGLRRRRHFLTEGRRLLEIEDELPARRFRGWAETLGLSGSSVLMAALSRAHTGLRTSSPRSAEQDEIIRAPLPGVR